MAITTPAGIVAAAKQTVRMQKNSLTSVGASPSSLLTASGNPSAGSATIGNTTAGVIVDDTVAGYPNVNAFGGGATGYLAAVDFGCSVAGRFALHDRIYNVGSISCTSLATTTLSGQPSTLGRSPAGTGEAFDIWVEVNAAVSNTATTCTVTYTNSAGTTGRSSGAFSIQNLIAGRLVAVPLQAGDSGVQKIESVIIGGTVATTGSINVIISRALWMNGRCKVNNDGDVHGWDKTLMPVVYDTTAFWLTYTPDSTATGIADCLLTVING